MPLDLQISATPPDPLGMAKVSGFYGPGAWAGWVLTIIASLHGILFRNSESKKIHNVILHLLYTNWAAIDLFRQLRAFRQAGGVGSPTAELLYASIAAAINVTYWGLVVTIVQFWTCLEKEEQRGVCQDRSTPALLRYIALLVGAIIPSLALCHLLFHHIPGVMSETNGLADLLPALYYPGISDRIHLDSLRAAGTIGLISIIFILLFSILFILFEAEGDGLRTMDGSDLYFVTIGIDIGALIIVMFVSIFMKGNYKALFAPAYWPIPVFYLYVLFACQRLRVLMPVFLVVYVVERVFLRDVGKSCLIMPCAPQGIKEWDQSFTLLVGLIMLGVESGPGLVRWARKRMRAGVPFRAMV